MNAFEVKNPDFESTIREKLKGQHFMHHIGFDLTEITAGKIVGEMDLTKKHMQQFGFVHGGVTATLMDITMGFAAYTLMPVGYGVVTANLSIDFLNPGDGDRIIAIGEVEKPGKKMVFCTAKIYTVKGEEMTQIASARSIMAVISRKRS
ncbi:MAG: PaaI family thioesterase [Bacteroidia bacterium]|nr:PaaI family thioesterase [Bacteroidia bacterium]